MASAEPVRVNLEDLGPGLPEPTPQTEGLDFHLEYLLAFDLQPLEATSALDSIARNNARALVHKLIALEKHASEDGVYVELPPPPKVPTLRFPRTLPLPKEKPLTRWQAFAQAKGIQKRKRSRLVWSEEKKDWLPRWGAGSAAHAAEAAKAVLEEKGVETTLERNKRAKKAALQGASGRKKRALTADMRSAPSQDPFREASEAKQLAKAKQQLREIRNATEASLGKTAARVAFADGGAASLGGSGKPSQLLPAGVPTLEASARHRKKTKGELKEIVGRAQKATASFGQHDFIPQKERAASAKAPGGKSAKPTLHANLGEERQSYMETLRLLKATKEGNALHAPPKTKTGK